MDDRSSVQASSRQSAPQFSPLLPAGVAAAESTTTVSDATLTVTERALIASAVPDRVREFATGRWCARQALSKLGIVGFSLLADPSRAPIWPEGIVGSITHVNGFCAAVVGPADEFAGIGIDAEHESCVTPNLWPHLFTAEERAWLVQLPDEQRYRMAALLFSAKESFYKCQYQFAKKWLDFTSVRVTVEGDRWRVSPASTGSLDWIRDSFSGRFAFADQRVHTSIVVRASALIHS